MVEIERQKRGRAPRLDPLPADSNDPIEIAMDRANGGAAERLLASHDRLTLAQLELARNELFRGRFHAARDVAFALLAAGLVVAIGLWVARAASSKAIVVEAFSVPPELAQRGLTGEVVAQRFLDQLLYIQAHADSVRAPASFANAWSGDLKVQIPTTGISLGEADRSLRRWLGNETIIGGEVIADGGQVRVSARSGGDPPSEAIAPAGAIDAALRHAAEGVFRQQQPYLYIVYLQDQSTRAEEAHQDMMRLARDGPPAEHAWAYNLLGLYEINNRGNLDRAEALLRQAIALDPTVPMPHYNLADTSFVRGRDGPGLAQQQSAESVYRQAIRDNRLKATAAQSLLKTMAANEADLRGDYAAAEQAADQSRRLSNYNNSQVVAPMRLAAAIAALHRPREALAILSASPPSPETYPKTSNPLTVGETYAKARMRIAAERGNWPVVLELAEGLDRWQQKLGAKTAMGRLAISAPWIALAKAELGDTVGAAAVIAPTPPDCTWCLRVRGRIAALAGRGAESDRWYRAAIASAPILPHAYLELAKARLARGDTAGALAAASEAAQRAPRWADPLKTTGDALRARRDVAGASERYAEAARLAPRWGALHTDWGVALWALSKRNEARAKLGAARRMDLTSPDRARLERLMRAAATNS